MKFVVFNCEDEEWEKIRRVIKEIAPNSQPLSFSSSEEDFSFETNSTPDFLLEMNRRRRLNGEPLLSIKTFGNFEVFQDSFPISLGKKAKEIMAYLVDKSGALVSNSELYGILYEDEPGHEESLKKAKKSLIDALSKIDCADVLVIQRGAMGINTKAIKCDLYDWESGKTEDVSVYCGEYMSQYSWAEYCKGRFNRRS